MRIERAGCTEICAKERGKDASLCKLNCMQHLCFFFIFYTAVVKIMWLAYVLVTSVSLSSGFGHITGFIFLSTL